MLWLNIEQHVSKDTKILIFYFIQINLVYRSQEIYLSQVQEWKLKQLCAQYEITYQRGEDRL